VPDRQAAVREICRVLAPGGRVVASTWRPRRHQPMYDALGQIAEKHLGPGSDKRWSFDGDELRALFESGGFTDVRVETASLAEHYAAFPIQGNVAAAGYTNIAPATMAAIETEIKAALAGFTAADGHITNQSVTNVIVARVP
jgi:YD repeat-containing protein